MGESGRDSEEPEDLGTGARWERAGRPRRRRRGPNREPSREPSRGPSQANLFVDDDDVDENDAELVEATHEYDDFDDANEDDEAEWGEDLEENSEEDPEEAEDWWDEDADDYAPPELTRSLRFGVLAMAPLLIGYELALAADKAVGSTRSVAEVVLSVPLEPLGRDVDVMRRFCLGGGLLVAFLLARRQPGPLLPRTLRVVFEGALAAFALGPLLELAAGYVEPLIGPLAGASAGPVGEASVQAALLAMGGAAYEEIVFRILLLSLVYVALRRLLMWAGSTDRSAGILAAVGAGLVSATVFAASHLACATAWLGDGGEPFEASAFTWRICAGILLSLLMVWRGVGVAAWAHAFYNLFSLLGLNSP